MATIRLVPSTIYNAAGTSYIQITNESNSYTNTDSSTYATLYNRNASTSSRYVYLRGFNFDDIPAGAIINSFTVKFKAYESGLTTSSSYRPYLANGTSTITGSCSAITTSTTTQSFTGVTATWDTIKGYGSNFGIRFNVRRSSRNTAGYLYLYGAEILVDYTIPAYHAVTVTNNTSAIVSANPTSVLEGNSSVITSNTLSNIVVTDNGNDVTNQFVLHSGTNGDYSTATRGTYGFALNNSGYYESQNKGINTSCAVCRVSFNLPVSATVTFQYINYAEATYDFGVFGNVDVALTTNYYPAGSDGATINETSYKKACNTSSDNTSSVQTLTYSNISAGDHFIDVKYSKDDASASNNDTLQFKVTITYNQSVSYYTYTINNVITDHAIVVSTGSVTPISVTGVSLNQNTASINVGSTVQLTATIVPSNATDKTVTWSTNNGNVTINNGLVTGVSVGTSIVTVTTHDGSYTASCTITVTQATTYDYVLTTSMEVGKKYLIANGNTGTVYLLSNESGGSRQLVGIAATVSGNKITINAATKAKAEFECVRYTSGNDVTITVKSDNKYLYTDSSTGLRMNAPSTLDRFWHYLNNKFWQFKSTSTNGYTDTSSEYKYYLSLNNSNNYTDNHITSPSIENTTIPAMYIYVEDDGSTPSTSKIYRKINGSWVQGSKVYVKINGTWVEQNASTWSTLFNTSTNYRLMT